VNEVRPDALRSVILVLLLGLAAAAWVALVWQPHDMHVAMASRAAPFLAIWVVMMVAMMLPTAAPMILAFHSAQAVSTILMSRSIPPGRSWRLICWCGQFSGLPLMPEY
jgi:predicted metal-binding membrane protein